MKTNGNQIPPFRCLAYPLLSSDQGDGGIKLALATFKDYASSAEINAIFKRPEVSYPRIGECINTAMKETTKAN